MMAQNGPIGDLAFKILMTMFSSVSCSARNGAFQRLGEAETGQRGRGQAAGDEVASLHGEGLLLSEKSTLGGWHGPAAGRSGP